MKQDDEKELSQSLFSPEATSSNGGSKPSQKRKTSGSENPKILSDVENFKFTSLDLESLRDQQNQFVLDRDWTQFHAPRNLLCALVGEVGELAEVFQWRGEVSHGADELSEAERFHLGEFEDRFLKENE